MMRVDGNQILGAGQIFWANTKYSPGPGTSPGLGGTLKTDIHFPEPVVTGGKGNLVGNYINTGVIFVGGYCNGTF